MNLVLLSIIYKLLRAIS